MAPTAKLVLVTGASAGFGEAIALGFSRLGWRLAIGARRVERLAELAPRLREAGAPAVFAERLDVTDRGSVQAFVAALAKAEGTPDCLVNNAGLARGVETIEAGEGAAWREMIEANVFGVLWTTRAVLPAMLERGSGDVVMLGSVAAHKAYAKGSVYCASKSAVWSIAQALRLETLGRGVRVISVDPGAAETEFSLVRFSGDEARAAKVYEGFEPLSAEDVADCVTWAVTRPPHVCIDQIRVMPAAQADPWHFHRTADAKR